jgi:hypothetical protein
VAHPPEINRAEVDALAGRFNEVPPPRSASAARPPPSPSPPGKPVGAAHDSLREACAHDAQCQQGQLRVEQVFDGASVGHFCTWTKVSFGLGAASGGLSKVAGPLIQKLKPPQVKPPTVTLYDDGYTIRATVPGDPKAIARVDRDFSTVRVLDVARGNQPAGSGSGILRPALESANLRAGDQLMFHNIINEQTAGVYEAGGDAANTVLGGLGRKTLNNMGLNGTNFRFQTSRQKLEMVIDVE